MLTDKTCLAVGIPANLNGLNPDQMSFHYVIHIYLLKADMPITAFTNIAQDTRDKVTDIFPNLPKVIDQ